MLYSQGFFRKKFQFSSENWLKLGGGIIFRGKKPLRDDSIIQGKVRKNVGELKYTRNRSVPVSTDLCPDSKHLVVVLELDGQDSVQFADIVHVVSVSPNGQAD